MTLHYQDDRATIYHGDCIEIMRTLPDNSVDSVVTDPPYGLEFMGKDWDSFSPVDLDRGGRWTKDKRGTAGQLHEDTGRAYGRVAYGANRSYTSECKTCGKRDAFRNTHTCDGDPKWERVTVDEGAPPQMVAFQAWCEMWTAECLRILKPGGHMLAFGGTRTWHRLAVAIEDAGFEVRDSIAWMYGSGFPKSLDVSKAIDKGEGHWRGKAGEIASDNGAMSGANYERTPKGDPITPAAQQWQGWGTALKPAFEPIVVARKPLIGTVAENVLAHGTGALNIDGCRIAGEVPSVPQPIFSRDMSAGFGASEGRNGVMSSAPAGRWPANVILDESQAAELDKQSGDRPGMATQRDLKDSEGVQNGIYNKGMGAFPAGVREGYNDTGGASRFFYCAKANKKERPNVDGVAHPTVKPLKLMEYLCRLVTPPGGTILEPFAGSGTTIEAALNEGFNVIGIEMTDEYLPLIMARIDRHGDKLC